MAIMCYPGTCAMSFWFILHIFAGPAYHVSSRIFTYLHVSSRIFTYLHMPGRGHHQPPGPRQHHRQHLAPRIFGFSTLPKSFGRSSDLHPSTIFPYLPPQILAQSRGIPGCSTRFCRHMWSTNAEGVESHLLRECRLGIQAAKGLETWWNLQKHAEDPPKHGSMDCFRSHLGERWQGRLELTSVGAESWATFQDHPTMWGPRSIAFSWWTQLQ